MNKILVSALLLMRIAGVYAMDKDESSNNCFPDEPFYDLKQLLAYQGPRELSFPVESPKAPWRYQVIAKDLPAVQDDLDKFVKEIPAAKSLFSDVITFYMDALIAQTKTKHAIPELLDSQICELAANRSDLKNKISNAKNIAESIDAKDMDKQTDAHKNWGELCDQLKSANHRSLACNLALMLHRQKELEKDSNKAESVILENFRKWGIQELEQNKEND